jgi:hypothetical protein
MAKLRRWILLSLIALIFQIQACNNSESNQQKTVFQKIPEIVEIKPQKPVKIKLKRSVNGDYSWELTGDDADKIIEIDRNLKQNISSDSVTAQ